MEWCGDEVCHSDPERSEGEESPLRINYANRIVDPSLSLRVTTGVPVLDGYNAAGIVEEEAIAELLEQPGGCRQSGTMGDAYLLNAKLL